ncbi:hypothetical protein, partial [Streptomyces luteogriseus]|uniref:hypothetical protein n=1 Tax=Streptomyces luteogriseus TaxID=68233 RepID=UPI0037905051
PFGLYATAVHVGKTNGQYAAKITYFTKSLEFFCAKYPQVKGLSTRVQNNRVVYYVKTAK